jgi:hypothetical protein
VPRRIRTNEIKVAGEWRKLLDEELHNLSSLNTSFFRMNKMITMGYI